MKQSYKICSKCEENKSLDDFYRQKQNKDGLHRWCKTCVDVYQAEYYQTNKKKLQKQNRKVRLFIKRERQLFVLKYLKTHHCVDCGESNPIVLDFDHVRGKKYNSISFLIEGGYSEENILKEIEKCEVRCANCHRKKTAIQFGWYDYIDFESMSITNYEAKLRKK